LIITPSQIHLFIPALPQILSCQLLIQPTPALTTHLISVAPTADEPELCHLLHQLIALNLLRTSLAALLGSSQLQPDIFVHLFTTC
jgi:hypothetical protein